MDLFLNYWYIVLFVIIVIISTVYGISTGNVKEWMRWMVLEAERVLGSGTGQAKLRWVYDKFVQQFPKLKVIIPFSVFSKWIDLALTWMDEQLNKNPKLREYISNEKV